MMYLCSSHMMGTFESEAFKTRLSVVLLKLKFELIKWYLLIVSQPVKIMSSLRERVKTILNLIEDPTQALLPVGESEENGGLYVWNREDFEYMKSFVEKNTRVHLQHLYVDLKKILSEGTYNTWMADTVTAAIKNVDTLRESINRGISARYEENNTALAATLLVDKAHINIEVPACVRESSWLYLVEVLDCVYEDLEQLIPQ